MLWASFEEKPTRSIWASCWQGPVQMAIKYVHTETNTAYSGLHTNFSRQGNWSVLTNKPAAVRYRYFGIRPLCTRSWCLLRLVKEQSVTEVSRAFRAQFGMRLSKRVSNDAWCKRFEQKKCICKGKVLECLLQLWTVFGLALDVPSQSWYVATKNTRLQNIAQRFTYQTTIGPGGEAILWPCDTTSAKRS